MICRLAVAACAVAICGCGTSTDRQTKTVEQERFVSGPIAVETPAGTITIQPMVLTHQREQVEVEQTKKVIDAPEVGAVFQAAASGSPLGAIMGVLGLGAAGAIGKFAFNLKRQRDELIDGVERAKDDMGEKWEALTGHLEAEQSADTKRAVKARVG